MERERKRGGYEKRYWESVKGDDEDDGGVDGVGVESGEGEGAD